MESCPGMGVPKLQAARARIERAAQGTAGHLRRTPAVYSYTFSEVAGAAVHLKLENLQRTGSCKVRRPGVPTRMPWRGRDGGRGRHRGADAGPLRVAPGEQVCAVVSGGHIDLNLLSRLIESGLANQGFTHLVCVRVPDVPGLRARGFTPAR
jgi:threonine dehydratase